MPSILSATSNMIVLTTDTIISKEMVFPTFLLFDLHFSRQCVSIQSAQDTFLNFLISSLEGRNEVISTPRIYRQILNDILMFPLLFQETIFLYLLTHMKH